VGALSSSSPVGGGEPLGPGRTRALRGLRLRGLRLRASPPVAGGLLTVLAVAETAARIGQARPAPGPGGAALWSALVAFAVFTTLPLGLLWAQPRAAAVAIGAAAVLSLGLFDTLTMAAVAAQLVALYRLGHTSSPVLAAGLAMPYLPLALITSSGTGPHLLAVLLASLAPVAAWSGIAARERGAALAHRAARNVIAGDLLEHTARGERARISRELHDVVAHHISMIAVLAETARVTTKGMPPEGAAQLRSIGDTARAALTEMRRLLGVLREDTGTDASDRRPQPGLGQLNELLDEARDASGTGIRLIVRGWLTTLDSAVELAAYRIVQEALTNARRHAPGAAVDVELDYGPDTLRVRVRDNGPGPPAGSAADGTASDVAPVDVSAADVSAADVAPTGGHGLVGMRERAAAVGGQLRTGAAAGGGFVVQASLPVRAEAAA
jgi:signal transduction histidine kinase